MATQTTGSSYKNNAKTTTSSAAKSSTEQKKSKGKRGLFVVRKNEETGQIYMTVNKGVEITVNGESVDLGEYRCLFLEGISDVLANIERLESEGKISEKAAETVRSICASKGAKYLVDGKLA